MRKKLLSRKWRMLILSLAFALPIWVCAQDDTAWKSHTYEVIRVTDGDTVTITDGNLKMKVRIAGIDAPESAQAYGKRAAHELELKLLNKRVQVRAVGSGLDAYNRILGQIYLNDEDVGVTFVRDGWATYYRPKCVDYPENKQHYDYDPRAYVEAERTARAQKRNIWSGAALELPCAYRKTARSSR